MNIEQMILTPNPYSYPGTNLKGVKGIVIHWYANPKSSALANRNFFENRKYGKSSYGSAQYLIGLLGEIIQAIPDNKMAYHVGSHVYTSRALLELGSYPNNCTIGIENAHVDWEGKMTDETYNSLVELTVHLLQKHNLDERHLWLHQEVVGWKDCHRWFVRHQDEWKKFKELVAEKLHGEKVEVNVHPVDMKDVEHVNVLGIGDRGNAVKDLQHQLNLLGANPKLVEDAIFGKLTQDCVEFFQRKHGLVVDGLVGKMTSKAIKESLDKLNNLENNNSNESYVGKRLESKVDNLDFYSRPTWNDKYRVGQVDKGWGFPTVINKVKVDDAYQYKVKNSKGHVYYITAHDKYVRLEGESKPQPKRVDPIYPYPGKIYTLKNPLMHDENVKRIQKRLNEVMGCNLKIDGYLGKNTNYWIGKFQDQFGLVKDYKIGIKSWSKLFG